MQFSKTPLIFYLAKNRADLYVSGQKKVISWALPDTIFRDLEVVDAVLFRRLLTESIISNKVKPDQVIIILSDEILFSINLPSGEENRVTNVALVKKFKSQTPFPSPFVKEIVIEKQQMAIALNRDLYDLLIDQFRGLDFEVTTLVPSQILPWAIPKTGLTLVEAQIIIQHWPKLEAQDFLEAEKKKNQLISSSTAQTPEDKRRTLVFVSIFGVLVVVLIIVSVMMVDQNKREKEEFEKAKIEALATLQKTVGAPSDSAENTAQLIEVESTGSESAQISTSESLSTSTSSATQDNDLKLRGLSVAIGSSAPVNPNLDMINNFLSQLGFDSVEEKNNLDLSSNTLTVNVGPRVTASQRSFLREEFRKVEPSTTVRVVSDMDFDVLVLLPDEKL